MKWVRQHSKSRDGQGRGSICICSSIRCLQFLLFLFLRATQAAFQSGSSRSSGSSRAHVPHKTSSLIRLQSLERDDSNPSPTTPRFSSFFVDVNDVSTATTSTTTDSAAAAASTTSLSGATRTDAATTTTTSFIDSNDNFVRPPPTQSPNDKDEFFMYSQQLYQGGSDGRTDAGLIQQAKRLLQYDLGLTYPSLLDDERFVWIGPYVDAPLSKRDYLAAGRFFNVRGAFADLDYRPYDFRVVIDQPDGSLSPRQLLQSTMTRTVRCTCRITGTMTGGLRLRNGVVLSPNGKVMICPPEAISITIDTSTGQVTKLCTGFALDRLVGNTMGTTGVVAASVIGGAAVPYWDLYPASYLVQRFWDPLRRITYIMETTNRVAPFPETVMIQLARGVLLSGMASQDPSLLSDTNFEFVTPTTGPINKRTFLESYARDEFLGYDRPNFSNFRVDPYDAERVWVDVLPMGRGNKGSDNGDILYVGPPQAISLTFDAAGYCTRITSWAVMDPTIGNAGGLGGPDGYRYATGQGRLGVLTRPLPRAVGRLRRRVISPITGIAVDDNSYTSTIQQPPPLGQPKSKDDRGTANTSKSTVSSSPKFTPVRPESPPPGTTISTRSTAATRSSKIPFQTPDDNAVVARLDKLKNFASSIRIAPPDLSKSFPLLPSLSNSDKPASSSSGAAATREAERKRIAIANALQIQKQAQLDSAAERKRREAANIKRQQQLAQQKEAQRRKTVQERQQEAEAKRIVAERQREVRERQQAAEARQRQQAADVKQKEAERQRRDKERQQASAKQAATEADRQRRDREQEARRRAEQDRQQQQQVAEARLREQQQKQREQQKQAEQKRREMAAKAKLADISAKVAARKNSSSKGSRLSPARDSGSLPLSGLAQATISLFGLGKSELEDLPQTKPTSAKRAPMGVPTLKRWRKNVDMTISGLVFGSRSFDDNERITTSPIASGTIASGQVVRTGSGTRYFLE